MKKTIEYIKIFFIVFSLLLVLLLATMKIPREAIENNLKKSTEYFKDKEMVEMIQYNREYTFLHLWSESVLLNIVYCFDTSDVLKSAMIDKYYESPRQDTNKDFIELIEENKEPNTQYLRYWHGTMIFLRPLLMLFSIQEIFNINYVIMCIAFITFLVVLLRKNKKIALLYVIAMITVAFPIVAISWLYSWTFYIMMITSIIAMKIEKKGNDELYKLFFITGMVTCFFDFLTTEIITLYVPILLILFFRREENKRFNFKENTIFVLKSSIIWLIGYASMWGAKWILASIVLKMNAMQYVYDNLKLRINGTEGLIPHKKMYSKVIPRNFLTLYPICNIKGKKRIIRTLVIIASIIVISIDWKNLKKRKFSLLLLIIALVPYLRYIVLANHSYKHFFFTYRDQIITIIAFGMILMECFNYNLWFKNIDIRKKSILKEDVKTKKKEKEYGNTKKSEKRGKEN